MSPKEFLDRKFASGKPRCCWMCGCMLKRGTATVDHLLPKSRGGRNVAENFAIACKPCNGARGDAPIPRHVADAIKGRAAPKRRDLSGLAAAIQRSRENGQ